MTPLDPLHSQPGRRAAPAAGWPAELPGSSAALTAARPASIGAYDMKVQKEKIHLSAFRQKLNRNIYICISGKGKKKYHANG